MTVTQEQIQNFTMPEPSVGMPVRWYRHGLKDASAPDVAFVLRVGGRNIHLRTAAGMVREAVRHVDDPKLQLSVEQREQGAWDFTSEHYELIAWKNAVEERLQSLESKQARMTTQAIRERQDDARAQYNALKSQATELGIEFSGNPKREWLEEKIAEFEKLTAPE